MSFWKSGGVKEGQYSHCLLSI